MKILLLGGTGVLSSDVRDFCLSQGDDVYTITRGSHKVRQQEGLHYIVADIRDLEDVKCKIGGLRFDVIVDFLSYNKSQLHQAFSNLALYCSQYIFISSACVYRRAPEDGRLTENSPKPNGKLLYSQEKFDCENYLFHLSKPQTNFTIVRPYITYGDTRIPFGIAPLARYHGTIIERIKAGKPFFIWDEGNALCTLLHTADFAKALYHLFGNKMSFNDSVNIVGDEVVKWKDVVDILFEELNADKSNILSVPSNDLATILPEYKESILGDRSLNAVFDNSKLKQLIPGFKQTISLREGIKRTLDYYRRNNNLLGYDYRYDARIDYLLNKYLNKDDVRKSKLKYIDYSQNRLLQTRLEYSIYRFLKPSVAEFIIRVLRKTKIVKL